MLSAWKGRKHGHGEMIRFFMMLLDLGDAQNAIHKPRSMTSGRWHISAVARGLSRTLPPSAPSLLHHMGVFVVKWGDGAGAGA